MAQAEHIHELGICVLYINHIVTFMSDIWRLKCIYVKFSEINHISMAQSKTANVMELLNCYKNLLYIDSLVRERRNCSALAVEFCLSCTESSIFI